MKILYVVGLLSALVAVPSTPVQAAEGPSTTLVVTTRDDSIELSVPVSRLTLAFPRGSLTTVNEPVSGATASARYFHFNDQKRGLVVSGWFEPGSSYSGFEKFWAGELLAMKNSGLVIRKAPDVFEA